MKEDTHSNENALVLSTLKILESIAEKFEPTTQEKHMFISIILEQFSMDRWAPWNYVNKIVMRVVQKHNASGENTVFHSNLTHVFIQLYKKINEEVQPILEAADKKQAIADLGHTNDTYKEEIIAIILILSELYHLRVDSHAFNHSNEMIYEVFRKLCDLEPILCSESHKQSSFMQNISGAFSSYFDNLVFRHTFLGPYKTQTQELPSIKNRFKVTEGLLEFGKSNDIFQELSEKKSKKDSQSLRIRGACNYLQLIQLAVSILYSSRTEFEHIQELRAINNLAYCYSKENYDCLFAPIIEALEDSSRKPNSNMLDHMVDCINKMLKYQQVFDSNNQEIFEHCLKNLVEIMPAKSENFTLTWTVIMNLVVSNPGSPITFLIPGFLKSFNEKMESSQTDTQRVRDSYRAITVLRLTEISAALTKSSNLQDLVQKQVQRTGIDTESTDFDNATDASWVKSYIDKFTSRWKDYIEANSQVDQDDISLAEANLNEAIELDITDTKKATPNNLLRTLIKKMAKAAAEPSVQDSQTFSASMDQASRFSLFDGSSRPFDSINDSEKSEPTSP